MSKHTPHTVKVNLENNPDQPPKKDGQSKKPYTRQPTPLQGKATVWRGQNKHGLKKIKHALLSSQETTTQPVQAPKTPKRIPDRSSEEGASAFPLCCVFTLAAAPNTHQIGAYSKMVCHHGMKNPPPPVTLAAFYDPSPPGSSSSLPDPRSTRAGRTRRGKDQHARKICVRLARSWTTLPCRGVLVTAWGEFACIPCNITAV